MGNVALAVIVTTSGVVLSHFITVAVVVRVVVAIDVAVTVIVWATSTVRLCSETRYR